MTYDYIQLDRNSGVPLYRQLYLNIRTAVESGGLKENDRLPSVRRLSDDLHLSCTTVESAYQQLCVEGYIHSSPHRGYFALDARREGPARRTVPPVFHRTVSPEVRYNFGTDCVDIGHTDIKIWRRNVRSALNRENVLCSYGEHQGEIELREALSSYSFGTRGVIATPEQIVIGAGTQPLLSILCGLMERRRSVAMEEPGFPQAEQVFSDYGISVLKLPGDSSGISMDALEKSGARLAYINPSNRICTGSSIPVSRRTELLRWAHRSGGIIIEDDYNGELRYRARPVPAMQGIAGGRGVVYLGSFSKLLLPSVRIGYMVLTPELLKEYLPRAANYNQTASKVEQLALAEYIRSGQMERHLRRLRKLYGAKSERLIKAMKNAFGGKIDILLEETPLTLILTVHTEKNADGLCRLAMKNGVRVQKTEDGKIRLGFAGIPIGDIEDAVQCLKSAWSTAFK
ncbi:MAG TPA: PLP-dependent aminotransferase family protein [Ruminococcaceae bacterium]|jgi:GntR family transcriptional regulator/MocR family aminotransferase|nr:PLP-dependent aminotransferase family protein [Oscillospiraceae bacterium]